LIVGSDHTAFTGGERLGCIKAERGQFADGAYRGAVERGWERMCRIFDDMETVTGGELLNSVHVAGLPGKMDRENCAGSAGDLLASLLGIDTKRYRIHI